MRFRRRAKLFPGVYLNFSKSGISTTIGVPGASINLSKKGTYLNTGILGTGIYNRQKIGSNTSNENSNNPSPNIESEIETLPKESAGTIKTDQAEATTTEGLQALKNTLLECYEERQQLNNEISIASNKLKKATTLLTISYILIIGFFIKWFKQNKTDKKEDLAELRKQFEDCYVNIDLDVDDQFDKKYQQLLENYKTLISCEKIWDITSSVSNDRAATRSAATSVVTRRPVKIGFGNIDIIKSKYDALHFENANGGDLYIYPAFLVIVDSHKKFGLVDIREIDFNFKGQRFIEEEKVPSDATVVDQTWAKVNKNGTPDKRFKGNYQIPICQYGDAEFSSSTGLNEAYSFSSFEKFEKFAESMLDYKGTIK